MAKVLIEFDTVDKTLAVSIDGTAVENVVCANVSQGYPREDEYCCEIVSGTKDRDNDIRTWTRVSASQATAGVFKPAKPSLAEELEAYFGKGRR